MAWSFALVLLAAPGATASVYGADVCVEFLACGGSHYITGNDAPDAREPAVDGGEAAGGNAYAQYGQETHQNACSGNVVNINIAVGVDQKQCVNVNHNEMHASTEGGGAYAYQPTG